MGAGVSDVRADHLFDVLRGAENMTDYQAARKRVERFMGGERMWLIYRDEEDAIRADLNLIAEHGGGQVETAPKVPAIDARTLMMAHVMGGLLADGYNPSVAVTEALAITDATLAALKGGE